MIPTVWVRHRRILDAFPVDLAPFEALAILRKRVKGTHTDRRTDLPGKFNCVAPCLVFTLEGPEA